MTESSTVWANGSNGQLLTHSNHLGTHLDGEIHFFTPGKDIASLDLNEFLTDPAAVIDLSDATGDYEIHTAEMIEERVVVRKGDTPCGRHHPHRLPPLWLGSAPYPANEIRYMVQHPGPDREFAEWCKSKKIRWIGVDCGSADHPMLHLCALACRQDRQAQVNTIIRNWMPRQAAEADTFFREMYGASLEERFTGDKYQLIHIEMFPYHIIHAECPGGDIDLLRSAARFVACNRRTTVGFSKRVALCRRGVVHRLGALRVGRCVAFVEDGEYEEMMARKAAWPKTRFGDGYNPGHVENIQRLTKGF